jgi:hypothetical protein
MASMNRQDPGFSLAERIMLMEGGTFTLVDNRVQMVFPWPNLQNSETVGRKDARICFVGEDPAAVPALFTSSPFLDAKMVIKDLKTLDGYGAVALDAQRGSFTMQMLVHAMETDEAARKMPILCLNCPQGYDTLVEALKSRFRSVLGGAIFVDGPVIPPGLEKLGIPSDFLMLPSWMFRHLCQGRAPRLFLTTNVTLAGSLPSEASPRPRFCDLEKYDKTRGEACASPTWYRNTASATSPFHHPDHLDHRGGDPASAHRVLVKRAIAYLDKNPPARSHLAACRAITSVGLPDQDLPQGAGISPWIIRTGFDLLATKLLRQTSLTINELPRSGFQIRPSSAGVQEDDGVNPGKISGGKAVQKS